MTKQYDFKTVEQMLYSYNSLKAEIIEIEIALEELKDNIVGISGKSNNEIQPGSRGNAFSSTVENQVTKREHEENCLLIQKRSAERQIRRIENMITTLSDEEQELVRLKYFDKLKYKELAYKFNVGDAAIKTRKALIVSSLANFLNNLKVS